MMNGLDFDTHAEEQAVELFATNILEAGKQFLERPLDAPFMPTWSRVVSAVPDIYERLVQAVEEDHKSFQFGGASGWSERASPLFNRSVVSIRCW